MSSAPLIISELKHPLNATLVTDSAGLSRVADFFSRVSLFGFDVETNITPTFYDRRIRTVQVGDRNEQYVVDLLAFAGSTAALIEGQGHRRAGDSLQPVVDTLRIGLESGKHVKAGVNLQFDYEAVRWCLGLRPWKFYDCMLAEKVIHCGAVHFMTKDFWGMEPMVERYCKLQMNKDLQKSFDLETPLKQEQIEYAALDTRLPLAIKTGQEVLIKQAGLQMAVDIENGAISSFGDMHLNGIKLDTTAWMKLVNETKLQHIENIKTLDTFFVSVVGHKSAPNVDLAGLEKVWRDEPDKELRKLARKAYQEGARTIKLWEKNKETYEGEAAINYSSNPQLLKAFWKMGYNPKKFKNTNDRTLEKFSSEPAVKALQIYRKTQKILNTYGESFIEKYINPDTGRVHSRINQLGAESGRTSSSDPNIQNIPKDQRYRDCFVSRPGWRMITEDYNGCELRIMAEASGEKVWLDAFAKNWDVHSVCAEIIFGGEVGPWRRPHGCAYYEKDHQKCECKRHKELRAQVKAINFGLAYGMEAGKLADELGLKKKEAQELLVRYRVRFPVVTAYLQRSGEYARSQLCSRTLSGRRRIFLKPEYQRAKEIAHEQAKRDGKDPLLIGSQEFNRCYQMLFGNIEREGKNTPIQGTNADMIKIALGDGFDAEGKPFLWQQLEPIYSAALVNMVHDELVVEAPDEQAQACRDMISDAMTRAGAVLVKKIPMTTEGHISDRWQK